MLEKDLVLEGKVMKKSSNFKHLGLEIQKEGETEREINKRLGAAKKVIAALISMLWSRDIINTKLFTTL